MTESSEPRSNPLELKLQKLQEARDLRPWRYFTPVPKVQEFHLSKSPIRLLTGPNGGGKTMSGAEELVCYLTGYNHFRDEHYPTPNRCWGVCVDRINQQPIMQRTLKELLPKGTRWLDKLQKFVLPSPWKSECYIKACEAGPNAFTAERIMAAWFDEEKPGDGLDIFKETLRRTKPGWPLRIFMTVTPLAGYSWSYDALYREDSRTRFKNVEVFNFSIYDAAIKNGGFLTDEEIKEAEEKCVDENDRRQRLFGEYTAIGTSPAFDSTLLTKAMERARVVPGERYTIRMGFLGGTSTPTLEKDPLGDLVIRARPQRGRQYVLGADPSMGVRRDRAVASIWDREIPGEVAYYASSKMEPVRFGKEIVAPLAILYNNALTAPECNSEPGSALTTTLIDQRLNLYMRQDLFRSPGGERSFRRQYGVRMDAQFRGMLFGNLKELLNRNDFEPSEDMVSEMLRMFVDENEKIDHLPGHHDDHVLAAGIALAVARLSPVPKYDPWGTYQELYSDDREDMHRPSQLTTPQASALIHGRVPGMSHVEKARVSTENKRAQ